MQNHRQSHEPIVANEGLDLATVAWHASNERCVILFLSIVSISTFDKQATGHYLYESGMSPLPTVAASDRLPLVHPLEYWNVCAEQQLIASKDISARMTAKEILILLRNKTYRSNHLFLQPKGQRKKN